MSPAERLYRYCSTPISVMLKVHIDTAESLGIAERLYEYCKTFMWKLQSVCLNTTERLYEYCRTFV